VPDISIDGNSMSSVLSGKFGLEIGPTLYFGLKNNLYINSGAMFSIKSFDLDGYGFAPDGTLDMTYLEIPLNVGLAIPLGKVQTYAQVGPYFGFKLSESVSDEYSESGLSDFNAGIGVMYGINIHKFKIELGYQYGLLDVVSELDSYETLNSLFLGVSYVF
jgi:hypothetical protein